MYEGKAILISGNGSYTGRTIFVNDAFDLYQRTYACVMKNGQKNILEYLFYTMKTYFVPKVAGGTHGSAIPYIVYDDIAKQKVLYNKKIVNSFMDKILCINDNILNLNRENQELTSLREFLLPLLMNRQVGFKKIDE